MENSKSVTPPVFLYVCEDAKQNQRIVKVQPRRPIDYQECLINSVRKYNFLYNHKNEFYKDHDKREDAWNDISSCVQASVSQCQKGWRSLRDRYVKEKQKSISSGRKCKWRYFNHLTFLDPYCRRRGWPPKFVSGSTDMSETIIPDSELSAFLSCSMDMSETILPDSELSTNDTNEEPITNEEPSSNVCIKYEKEVEEAKSNGLSEESSETSTTYRMILPKPASDLISSKMTQRKRQLDPETSDTKNTAIVNERHEVDHAMAYIGAVMKQWPKHKRQKIIMQFFNIIHQEDQECEND